ncbi:hypothetical protein PDJAM_G00183430 [Pangasius djambal]|uniref:Uncharacterized protein n=1 Tax=Pangasius djambal TaxID=1691987 RepID=A0ACC5Y3Q8_9TELE|nr:hypothetical protein [Pangasius djambal]
MSTTRLFKDLGIQGQVHCQAIKALSKATEKSSQWLWMKTAGTERGTREFYANEPGPKLLPLSARAHWKLRRHHGNLDCFRVKGSPAGGTVRFDAAPARPLITSPRSVSAVRITPLRTMKSCPDLMPTELDPTRVCKGKGAVTLKATLVHVDDGDCITQERDVNPAKSECHRAVNGDATETNLAEKRLNSTGADLNSDQVSKATTQVECPISLGLSDLPSSATVPSVCAPNSSVYPTIVLLQHGTDAVEQQHRVCDQGSTETQVCFPPEDPQRSSTQMEGKRMMITVHPASPVPLEKPRVPVRNTEKSKDWYKNMFKQIHRVPETVEENPYRPTYIFPESYDRPLKTRDDSSSHMDDYGRSVPRSKSAVDMSSSQSRRRVSMPTRTSSLRPERNEWEPPDKKVDTRKYRAEPRSIFDYEPGKSSVLRAERPDLTPEDVDLENEPWYRFYSEMEFGKTVSCPCQCDPYTLYGQKLEWKNSSGLHRALTAPRLNTFGMNWNADSTQDSSPDVSA